MEAKGLNLEMPFKVYFKGPHAYLCYVFSILVNVILCEIFAIKQAKKPP